MIGRVFSLLSVAMLTARPVNAAQWSVDYARSKLGFTVQWSGEPFFASFKKWQADIDFDPNDLSHAHATITIDLASESSDEPDFDSGLKGAEGFATSRFPAAIFVTRSFARTGPNSYVAQGTLSLHGLTRAVKLPFALSIADRSAHMTGTAHVRRTDFALGQGEWAGPDPVAYNVAINVDLRATQ